MKELFSHLVFFWLKEPDNSQHRSQFETALKHFIEHSDFVVNHHIGVPAQTPRAVVDNSYTYCLMASFYSKEDQDQYQNEQVHLDFIQECEALWERVQVYDSLSIDI